MPTPMETLSTKVAAVKGAANSATAAIRGFKAALDAALPDLEKVQALSDDLGATEADLVNAVLQNPLPGEVVVPPTV